MSIFSPCSSVMTFLTRLPMGPMHAPLAFTPGWCEATAILVRCPASRAIATISTAPEAISGTSSEKSFLTRPGWVRDNVIDGPRYPLRTCNTKQRNRSPCTYRSPGTCSVGGRIASILPRSTRTARGSFPCWITPATMSPSRPAYSPKVSSSSASRSRCKMTCRAVVAAIRPKPAGVWSYSRSTWPSSPVSAAQTVTCPVVRSTSTRAVAAESPDLWYATSSASSMALIARSIEMSFSLSRLRRTLRSMSIPAPPVPRLGAVKHRGGLGSPGLARPAELDLHPPRAELVVIELDAVALDAQRHRRLAGQENPAVDGRRPARRSRPAGIGRGRRRERGADQPALGAAPVPGLGQRPVHPRGRHLEGVRDLAHDAAGVQAHRHFPADLGDLVQSRPAVGIDHQLQQPAPPGRADPDRLQVHPRRADHRFQHAGQVGRLGQRACRAHPLGASAARAPSVASPRA